MIYRVGDCITKLAKELLGRFVNLQYIREADSVLDVDYTDPALQLSNRQLRLGLATRQFIQSEDIEGTPKINNFYQEVREFFITALTYIRDKFPHNDKVVNNAIVLDVTKRTTVDITNISALLERFPGLLEKDELTSLENEFLEYQLLDDNELPDTTIIMADGTFVNRRVDEVWFEIVNMKNLVTGRQRFPVLGKFIAGLLVIPHSNADCERLFSMVRKNRTEMRSSMTVDTLSALIASKINLFRNVKCHQFKPGKDLLRQAKKATVLSLNRHKKVPF